MQNKSKNYVPIFIDIKKAQKLFCLSRCKLLELIYNKEIIASKKCGKWLILTKSLEDFLMEDFNQIQLKEEGLLSDFKKF